ncbi:MAG: phenylacetate--CoA ligase family protein [Myxococcota bacterium]
MEARPRRAPVSELFAASDEALNRYRLERIRDILAYAAERSPWHRERLARLGVEPDDIRTLADFARLPLMTKADVRDHNDAMTTVASHDVREVFTSSATTGAPITLRYTAEDLDNHTRKGADLMAVGGIDPGDLVQITFPLGARMWVAGISMWMSLQERGAGTVRFGPGDAVRQLEAVSKLGVTGMFATGGFARRLGQVARERGLLDDLPLRKLMIVNENLFETDMSYNVLGQTLRELWPGREIRATYGSTELAFGGVECAHHTGYHTHPAAHYFEVVDPSTGAPAPPGTPGRLVVTALRLRGMPLIRYAIDDVSLLATEPCPCGIRSERLGPVLGRLDDLLKPKGGVSTYPVAIEGVLHSIPYVTEFDFEVHRETGVEDIRLHVAAADDAPEDPARAIREIFARELHFRPEVMLSDPGTIAARVYVPGKRKPQRFRDLRGGRG